MDFALLSLVCGIDLRLTSFELALTSTTWYTGAGTGLVSIVLSAAFAQCRLAERAGATESQSAIRITATDLRECVTGAQRLKIYMY